MKSLDSAVVYWDVAILQKATERHADEQRSTDRSPKTAAPTSTRRSPSRASGHPHDPARQGPYVLVLTKVLFMREAAERKIWTSSLVWPTHTARSFGAPGRPFPPACAHGAG